ncbi:hypothetical protein [Clavibacter michiganensis]|nr:hypothetical protein [Clavibacter michiganensis]
MTPAHRVRRLRVVAVVALVLAACAVPVAFLPARMSFSRMFSTS